MNNSMKTNWLHLRKLPFEPKQLKWIVIRTTSHIYCFARTNECFVIKIDLVFREKKYSILKLPRFWKKSNFVEQNMAKFYFVFQKRSMPNIWIENVHWRLLYDGTEKVNKYFVDSVFLERVHYNLTSVFLLLCCFFLFTQQYFAFETSRRCAKQKGPAEIVVNKITKSFFLL